MVKNDYTDNYIRPEETLTDRLSKKEIKEQLIDHEMVDNMENVPIGSQIRYITEKDGKSKFKFGGTLIIKSLPDYVVLSNGRLRWSVQIKDNIFFKRISIDDVKASYEKIIEKQNITINALKQERKKHKAIIEERDIVISALKKLVRDLKSK